MPLPGATPSGSGPRQGDGDAQIRSIDIHTGHGDGIAPSLLEPRFPILGPMTLEASSNGRDAPRQKLEAPTPAPRRIHQTRDGEHVALSAAMEPMVKRPVQTMGEDELASDLRYATHAARIANSAALNPEVADLTLMLARDECLA